MDARIHLFRHDAGIPSIVSVGEKHTEDCIDDLRLDRQLNLLREIFEAFLDFQTTNYTAILENKVETLATDRRIRTSLLRCKNGGSESAMKNRWGNTDRL